MFFGKSGTTHVTFTTASLSLPNLSNVDFTDSLYEHHAPT